MNQMIQEQMFGGKDTRSVSSQVHDNPVAITSSFEFTQTVQYI